MPHALLPSQCILCSLYLVQKHVLMVDEEIVKKQSEFCLGVEGWSIGFEVAVCKTVVQYSFTHQEKVVTLFVQR